MVPLHRARAHVHDAPEHLVTFAGLLGAAPDVCSRNFHCPNFHIARSKFPEIRGLAYCMRVARTQCTITPLVMHQRIALVELYQYAKFRVASSKFTESKGAYAYA